MRSVLNGLTGAAADTCHAVGTVLSPQRPSLFKADIVKRTDPNAFSTGNTGVIRIKLFRMDKQRIEDIIHNPAVHLILKAQAGL